MIYLYTDKQDSGKWILQNDLYFNLYTSNERFTEEDRELIWQIDHAKLNKDKHIETKYGLGTIRNLSSGCKTILNIMKNPGKVVNANEWPECTGYSFFNGRYFFIYDQTRTNPYKRRCRNLF